MIHGGSESFLTSSLESGTACVLAPTLLFMLNSGSYKVSGAETTTTTTTTSPLSCWVQQRYHNISTRYPRIDKKKPQLISHLILTPFCTYQPYIL
jgi:hypothetical protein